jgi:hypothetical protein
MSGELAFRSGLKNIEKRASISAGQFSSAAEQRFCNSRTEFCLLWQWFISSVFTMVFSLFAFCMTDSILPQKPQPVSKTSYGFSGLPGIEDLAKTRIQCKFDGMKTLTVEEATPGLGRLVELALAGERIQIRKGSGIVELRPAQAANPAADEKLTPCEALRLLQEDARMTPQQAERYLRELREERLAAEDRRSA